MAQDTEKHYSLEIYANKGWMYDKEINQVQWVEIR